MSERIDEYIQMLGGFADGIKRYAIYSLDDDTDNTRLEVDPIKFFGPLGRINIFVGATNAGKSRFLRLIATHEEYQLIPIEIRHAFSEMTLCAEWLASSKEEVKFRIGQSGVQMHDGTPLAFANMPQWVKNALPGIRPMVDYDLLLNTALFKELLPNMIAFVEKRVQDFGSRPDESWLQDSNIITAYWAYNLLSGEILARKRDEVRKQKSRYASVEHLESLTKRYSNSIKFDIDKISVDWRDNYLRLWQAFETVRNAEPPKPYKPAQTIYVPTLRSAVSLRDQDGKRLTYDIFEQTVKLNYGLDKSNVQVFTGNRLYDTLKRDRNGTPEVVARLRDFEKFLSTAFYESRNVEVVALDESFDAGQHISVRVQGETPRELHHLGDGINTLIILLYQLFMAEPGSWVFIEEPELNLHPGLQRLFLQTIIENEALEKRDLRVFFTTHSNHLLRMTLRDGTIAAADLSVFAFQQRASDTDSFLIRPLVTQHHDALALLGVQNASVLLAQCGIWVEGVTDRQYLRAYLKAYQDSAEFKKEHLRTMREDTHFAFWEYAGSNLSHYIMSDIPRKGSPQAEEYERGQKDVLAKIESSALCNRIFLLADRDEKKQRKHDVLKAVAKDRTNFAYYVTPCIEIENLLSPTELKESMPEFLCKKSIPQVTLDSTEYKDVRLGTYLAAKYPNAFPLGWEAASGTLETDRKNRLCEIAVKHITWDSMSKEAKTLTKELYKFIAKHNTL